MVGVYLISKKRKYPSYPRSTFRQLFRATVQAFPVLLTPVIIIGITGAFAWWLSLEKIPQLFTDAIYGVTQDRLMILILIIILVEGCFLDATPIVLIMVPMLMPLLKTLNVDLVYFGILISVNTMIGLTTPPVGVCLFGVSAIAKLSIEKIVKAYLPFLGVLIAVMFLLLLFPGLSTWLPNLLFK